MWTAGFPEPRTFSLRAARLLRERLGDFDVVHDNQTLGYGAARHRARPACRWSPRSTTRSPSTAGSTSAARRPWRKRLTLRRWYGFVRMQAAVARQAAHGADAVASPRQRDVVTRLRGRPGADAGDPARRRRRASCRRPSRGCPGRILAMASADAPMKGIATLLEAFAKLRTERDVELLLVTRPQPGGPHRAAHRRARDPRPRALRARHQRRRAGRADGLGRGRLRAVASTRASRCRRPS